jgi:transcriptional regulator with XRE-family HTH domain
MLFSERIRQLREEKQLLQRHFTSALEIDMSMFSKIERSERQAKCEQLITIANLLKVNPKELLIFWLAEQIYEVVEDKKELGVKALIITQKHFKK